MNSYDEIVEAFVQSTSMVLGTCCGLVDMDFRRSDGRMDCSEGDIVGVMGMAGDSGLTATMAFSSNLAVRVVSLMIGAEEHDLTRADVNDGITEFLNMVCGNAKALLNREGYNLSLSVPAVIRAQEYQIGYHHDVRMAGVSIDILGGTVQLRLNCAHSPVRVVHTV